MLRGAVGEMRKILVAIDFSRESHAALEYAAMLAVTMNASLTLFHACTPPSLMSPIVPGADNDVDAATSLHAASDRLAGLRADLSARGFSTVTVTVQTGTAAEAIVEHAAQANFDLVVMGTHGRTGLNRLVMGSVAERVVRLAACPVLTVHVPKKG